jgi:hypothetical protein
MSLSLAAAAGCRGFAPSVRAARGMSSSSSLQSSSTAAPRSAVSGVSADRFATAIGRPAVVMEASNKGSYGDDTYGDGGDYDSSRFTTLPLSLPEATFANLYPGV